LLTKFRALNQRFTPKIGLKTKTFGGIKKQNFWCKKIKIFGVKKSKFLV